MQKPKIKKNRALILLPNEICAIITAFYGIAGVVIYGPRLSQHPSAERVQQLESAEYRQVLLAHLTAAVLLAAPSLFGQRSKISFQANSLPTTSVPLPPSPRVVAQLKRVSLLALTPAFLMIIGFQDLLLSRPGYLTGPRIGFAFKLGSPTYTAGVLILVGTTMAMTRGRRPWIPFHIWCGLTLYLLIGAALGTREIAVPAAALTYLVVRRHSPRAAMLLAPLASLLAISLALSLRSSPEGHGLLHYLPLILNPITYFASVTNGIANALNGFHGSGAALHDDFDSKASAQILWSLLNPFEPDRPENEQSLLDFGYHFPIPTLGYIRSLGLKYFIVFFGGAGIIFNILGRIASSAQRRGYLPLATRLSATAMSYGLAIIFSLFSLQYKLHSTVVPLKLAVLFGLFLTAFVYTSDATLALKVRPTRLHPQEGS